MFIVNAVVRYLRLNLQIKHEESILYTHKTAIKWRITENRVGNSVNRICMKRAYDKRFNGFFLVLFFLFCYFSTSVTAVRRFASSVWSAGWKFLFSLYLTGNVHQMCCCETNKIRANKKSARVFLSTTTKSAERQQERHSYSLMR